MARELRQRAALIGSTPPQTRKSQRLSTANHSPSGSCSTGISPSSSFSSLTVSPALSFASTSSYSTTPPTSPCPTRKRARSQPQRGFDSDEQTSCPVKRSRQLGGTVNPPDTETTYSSNSQGSNSRADAKMAPNLATMPNEVQQLIAGFLPSDDDVKNYLATCKSMNNCITDSVWRARFLGVYDRLENSDLERYLKVCESSKRNGSSWRVRFLREYHQIEWASSKDKLQALYEQQYKFRQTCLTRLITFNCGPLIEQEDRLFMLQSMVLESNAQRVISDDGKDSILGYNHTFFREYFSGNRGRGNLADSIWQMDRLVKSGLPKAVQALASVLQLCFIHLALHPKICNELPSGFHTSQEQVYKCPKNTPLFKGENMEINFAWLLHCANFFKFHLKKTDGEGILSHMYQQLNDAELPKPWAGKLKNGTQELGKHWKCAFTFLEENELKRFRVTNTGEQVDETSEGNDGFQDLTFFFDIEDQPELQFPSQIGKLFGTKGKAGEPAKDPIQKLKIRPEVKDFFGLGFDGSSYHLHGRVHSLPPQQGVPGFQRVTMMKYLPDSEGRYGVDRTGLWAYEGCVLPGNQMIIGRWWCPNGNEHIYSGPFIAWAVSGTAENKLKGVDDALKFLEVVEEATEWAF